MADRPLLAMPRPARRQPPSGQPPRENIPSADKTNQNQTLGPKFERMDQVLGDPALLADLRNDPSAIIPERALVFEVASNVADFYRAARGIPGLEFLGEDEGDAAADEDFFVPDADGEPRSEKPVPRRFYFTIPDQTALRQLVGLWRRYQRGEVLGRGRTAWRDVFGHLADVRPWGPQDRLTVETKEDWQRWLEVAPDEPIRLEAEFWYRDNAARREVAETGLSNILRSLGAEFLDRSVIEEIRYHAALVQAPPAVVRDLLEHSESGLVAFDDLMSLRPQSMVAEPLADDLTVDEATGRDEGGSESVPENPVAALLDGVPMMQHDRLAGHLVLDDPDNFSDKYGSAAEQRHGTAMASLILHGDLNATFAPPPIKNSLYVRPILFAQPDGMGSVLETMPPDRLGADLIWRAFIRMFDGEGGEGPTAPTVRIVNLSIGDAKRRFAGVMSPWARLVDYLAWKYDVLILVSAGNIADRVPLDDVQKWADFQNVVAVDRQSILLRAISRQRAGRMLLAPSEAINALTVGAAHIDQLSPSGAAPLAVDPYENPTLPNPSSALGLGFKGSIKPEILFPGGSEQIRGFSTHAPIEIGPVAPPGRFFGIGVANPGPAGQTDRKLNMTGTSVATALATHSALRIFEALENLPNGPAYPKIDHSYYPVILKALLVHSARWNVNAAAALKSVVNPQQELYWEHERYEISRFLGFGCPNVAQVVDCAENRATLVGWHTIHSRATDRFLLPLPSELDGLAGFRALTVTIAWLTPITLSHRMYRLAKFKAGPGSDKEFSMGVGNAKRQPSHNALGKGTVYHHRWEGEDAAEFVDGGNLLVDVTCTPAADDLDEPIPYAVAVTLEVGQDVPVPVYERIRARLRAAVALAP